MILAVGLALLLFVYVPVRVARLIAVTWLNVPVILGLLEGLIRMSVFILYIFLVSRIKDIKRGPLSITARNTRPSTASKRKSP